MILIVELSRSAFFRDFYWMRHDFREFFRLRHNRCQGSAWNAVRYGTINRTPWTAIPGSKPGDAPVIEVWEHNDDEPYFRMYQPEGEVLSAIKKHLRSW